MKLKQCAIFATILLLLGGCKKDNQTAYKTFLGTSEVIYTGAVSNVVVQPGNHAIGLKWKASSDPSVSGYVIYYNNRKDSALVEVTGHPDTIRAVIRNLAEYTYSFLIYSFDAKGNRSVPVEVGNAKVYGSTYISTLNNRGYDGANPYIFETDGRLTLNFVAPDTINVNTLIRYTDGDGKPAEVSLAPNVNSVTLPSYKPSTPITYQSSYIPAQTAIDVFTVPAASTFPQILSEVVCNKSLFAKMFLTNDVPSDYGDEMERLWDGSVGPQAHPNIFHTKEMAIPHAFSFDMGKIYEHLSKIEETGRNSDHNPALFEVWGINDINGAVPSSDPASAGWKADMLAKGWTLLQECSRSDNGQQPMQFKLIDNPPPVRYIRIRVTKTVDNNRASNWGELTFWNKQ